LKREKPWRSGGVREDKKVERVGLLLGSWVNPEVICIKLYLNVKRKSVKGRAVM
jgi:hypothetical protein